MKKYLLILSLSAIGYMGYSQDKKLNIEALDASNPFATEFNTPKNTPPFDLIKEEHYMPAFISGMAQQATEINAIANSSQSPTFENTVVALDESGELLNRVSSVFYSMTGAMTNPNLQAIAADISPKMSEHSDNIYLNEQLFNRIKAVYDNMNGDNKLTVEDKRLIDKYYKAFVRSGIMLDETKKSRLREINKELGLLSLNFGKNLLAETNSFELVIENSKDLSGLPSDVIEVAAGAAKTKGYDGKWVFTLSKPSWVPFLQYADSRQLREVLYKAMYNRGNNGNEHDNNDIINKIVNLRLEKANMLGYKTHADFVLAETMAKTPENVSKLLNNLWEYALPQAKKEKEELQKMIDREGGHFKLESWDWWYYTEKLRKEKYNLDEEEIKPYFMIDNVRDGAFMVANKLYGLNFKELDNVPVYQKDVKAFEVTGGDGSYIGVLYLDYFPRAEKRNGAWMGSFRKQQVYKGKYINPIIYNVGNFALPTEDKPSLLTLEHVTTLFHEFGHALHGLLSDCKYNGLSGTSVSRDFVELPSQIYEHWALHPDVLKMYAKHYQTGEAIPDALIKKIQEASNFNKGFETTELVAAAILDMKWHTIQADQTLKASDFEDRSMNEIGLIPEIIVRYKSPYFAHIFDGGYSSGYYSYLWSEVLDADAFQAFEENGIFDPKTANLFREFVLSKGGSEDPMTLYKRFRGAEPNPIYMIKNRGFIK
ncbi:M3 family peptidase [Dysgonomonas sp. 216]|uniref:M3 family metallopeptidase n=1 Tax=Dysgonomonas sp. 216 TaxID=2302934 RepID=UPI0013D19C01|nr:M3 family metallopeptidase [Dysgonomonas sp. 216]NDW19884.1 M3 family peptidase [Dysgonomonas sp. 216]